MFAAFRIPLSWRELLTRTWREINEDNCLGLAAQLAYYFILALFPALIVVVAIASFFPPSALREVLNALAPFTPPEALALIRTHLDAILASEQTGLLSDGAARRTRDVARLSSDRERASRLGDGGRRHGERTCESPAVLARVEHVYTAVIAKRRGSRG